MKFEVGTVLLNSSHSLTRSPDAWPNKIFPAVFIIESSYLAAEVLLPQPLAELQQGAVAAFWFNLF
jgi:hypothetical protein